MSEELAIKIFKQLNLKTIICEKCPRKDEKEHNCYECLNSTKESLLNYIEQLQEENKKLKGEKNE